MIQKKQIFLCMVVKEIYFNLLKLPDGTVKVLVEGIKRVKILDFKDNEKFITCDYTPYNDVIK